MTVTLMSSSSAETLPSSADPALTSPEFLAAIPRDFARQHLIISQGRISSDSDEAPTRERFVIAETTNPAAMFNVAVLLQVEPVVSVSDGESIARAIDEAYAEAARQVDANTVPVAGRDEGADQFSTLGGVGGGEVDRLVSEAEADRVRIPVDGQYLKVVVEDELGVEIELDQRSEGFQWLVSFFVVFFSEAADKHKNAVLLLDEPGLSLHGLKQREFQTTISRLATNNQTIYTTHSPFLVGANELDRVRVVEMVDRRAGTNIHVKIVANDPASLLPLQEALGYDLAQSLFSHERNLVLEGLTDYWYVDATVHMLRAAGIADLNEKIALIPAGDAGKVVYFATILHANKLKVAALLDSDTAGENAAKQDTLVHRLGNRNILRTKDDFAGTCTAPEIEDLLRETLIAVAKADLGWDVAAKAKSQPARPIVDIFAAEVSDFSKYKLAKAYLRWTRANDASALTNDEQGMWKALIQRVNKALK